MNLATKVCAQDGNASYQYIRYFVTSGILLFPIPTVGDVFANEHNVLVSQQILVGHNTSDDTYENSWSGGSASVFRNKV
jgi:hypothetical protein